MPLEMRRDLIQELHESKEFRHLGVKEIVRRLARTFVIPQLRSIVQDILGNYLACYQNKPKRHKPYRLLQLLLLLARLQTSVTIDFIVKLLRLLELGSVRLYDTILVIVDRLTKVAKFILTKETIIVEELAYEVTKALISNYKLREQFITD